MQKSDIIICVDIERNRYVGEHGNYTKHKINNNELLIDDDGNHYTYKVVGDVHDMDDVTLEPYHVDENVKEEWKDKICVECINVEDPSDENLEKFAKRFRGRSLTGIFKILINHGYEYVGDHTYEHKSALYSLIFTPYYTINEILIESVEYVIYEKRKRFG